VLGAAPDGVYSISLFGHALTLWNEIGILAAFGAAMILLAIWSFGNQA
jgi:hypothetical protein